MITRPSASIQQNYDDIAKLARDTGAPICLTTNGKRDLVIMDAASFERKAKLLSLWEKLLSAEEERMAGKVVITLKVFNTMMDEVID